MSSVTAKCHVCVEKVVPDLSGNCPRCHTNLLQVVKDPAEKIEFFCAVCDRYFIACRDGTGYDQAPCPSCGDLSNTPEFHGASMLRNRHEVQAAWIWIVKILAILFFTGAGYAIFRSLTGQ